MSRGERREQRANRRQYAVGRRKSQIAESEKGKEHSEDIRRLI